MNLLPTVIDYLFRVSTFLSPSQKSLKNALS